jgi:hypothetical protein
MAAAYHARPLRATSRVSTGTLLIFDARAASPHGDDWATRDAFSEATTPGGRAVTVLRLQAATPDAHADAMTCARCSLKQ